MSSGSPSWIDCGIYQGTFSYIIVAAADPYAFYSVTLNSVLVEP
jgi:hypothetical protein